MKKKLIKFQIQQIFRLRKPSADNISKTQQETEHDIYNKINKESNIIADNYGVSERVDCFAKPNAVISLKDHKLNFSSNPKCRLMHPAKSKIRKISKYFQNNLIVRSEIYHQ